jgi:hypothetical protein
MRMFRARGRAVARNPTKAKRAFRELRSLKLNSQFNPEQQHFRPYISRPKKTVRRPGDLLQRSGRGLLTASAGSGSGETPCFQGPSPHRFEPKAAGPKDFPRGGKNLSCLSGG